MSSIFKLLLPAPKFNYPPAVHPVRHFGPPHRYCNLTVNVFRFYTELGPTSYLNHVVSSFCSHFVYSVMNTLL